MRVLILCNAGMSSSILVKKIKETADSKKITIDIFAKSTSDIDFQIGKCDLCLVAPQILYAIDSIKSTFKIPTLPIDFKDYAMANGNNILEQILSLQLEK